MNFDADLVIRSVISMLVITMPFDPVKVLVFNAAIADPPRGRAASAIRVALYIGVILAGSALFGRPLLDILGVNLDAFAIVGGLVIALMGFEMLYGGGTSKAQGENVRQRGPKQEDTLMIPLSLPLIAGPGAITTTITIASQGESSEGLIVALVGVGVVVLSAFLSYAWLGELLGKMRQEAVSVLARIGGLLLATIGAQMVLAGLKRFFS